MAKYIIRIFFVLVIIGILSMYIYGIVVQNDDLTEHLFRTIGVTCVCVAGLIRSFTGQGRHTLDFYDQQYFEFGEAFADQPFWRKKLLCALRLYNENKFEKALKYLLSLRERCSTVADTYAVWLFSALCFTDMGLYEHAEKLYNQMILAGSADSRIFSNLGNVQNHMGKSEAAILSFQRAIEHDRKNPVAYNNLAQAYFDLHDFENAIIYAEKALEISTKTYQAATLLAIIYHINEDLARSDKYYHIAVSNGQDPQKLKDAMEHYRTVEDYI